MEHGSWALSSQTSVMQQNSKTSRKTFSSHPVWSNFDRGVADHTLSITTLFYFQKPVWDSSLQVLDLSPRRKLFWSQRSCKRVYFSRHIFFNGYISLYKALGGRGLLWHSSRDLWSAAKAFQMRTEREAGKICYSRSAEVPAMNLLAYNLSALQMYLRTYLTGWWLHSGIRCACSLTVCCKERLLSYHTLFRKEEICNCSSDSLI